MEELEPCPFCSAQSVVLDLRDDGFWFIKCNNCFARGPINTNKECAIHMWNLAIKLKQS